MSDVNGQNPEDCKTTSSPNTTIYFHLFLVSSSLCALLIIILFILFVLAWKWRLAVNRLEKQLQMNPYEICSSTLNEFVNVIPVQRQNDVDMQNMSSEYLHVL